MRFGNADTRPLAVVKAEEMARAGKLSASDRVRIERHYGVRLAAPERRDVQANDVTDRSDDNWFDRDTELLLDPEAYRA